MMARLWGGAAAGRREEVPVSLVGGNPLVTYWELGGLSFGFIHAGFCDLR